MTRWVTRDQLKLVRLSAEVAAIARDPSARAQNGKPRAKTVRAVRLCPVALGILEADDSHHGPPNHHAFGRRLTRRSRLLDPDGTAVLPVNLRPRRHVRNLARAVVDVVVRARPSAERAEHAALGSDRFRVVIRPTNDVPHL